MRVRQRVCWVLGILCGLGVCPLEAASTVLSGTVSVASGDTLVFRSSSSAALLLDWPVSAGALRRLVPVRLAGIAAVQADQRCGRGEAQWACGERARRALAVLVGNDTVHCSVLAKAAGAYRRAVAILPGHFLRGQGETDAHELLGPGVSVPALVAECATDAISDLGREVLKAGFAVAERGRYRFELAGAVQAGRGMWVQGPSGGFAPPDEWLLRRVAAIAAHRKRHRLPEFVP